MHFYSFKYLIQIPSHYAQKKLKGTNRSMVYNNQNLKQHIRSTTCTIMQYYTAMKWINYCYMLKHDWIHKHTMLQIWSHTGQRTHTIWLHFIQFKSKIKQILMFKIKILIAIEKEEAYRGKKMGKRYRKRSSGVLVIACLRM